MQIENKVRLSYYRKIAVVDEVHSVDLVQNVENNRIFVMKIHEVYDIKVYEYLAENPSPGIPKIVELIEDNDLLYVIEEYVSGITLRNKLDESGAYSETEAISLIRQLCSILRPLHGLDPPIVHRDIKPSNLLITADGELVLIDFNSAKESKYNQRKDTILIGTIDYAAPEQYGFSVSQPATDIYAIGVLLNELLTGQLPNHKGYDGRLKIVIKTCLEMDPSNRYQSVDDLLLGIDAAMGVYTETRSTLRTWLPPGFRGKNVWIILLSALWYMFIVFISFSMEVEDAAAGELLMERIFSFLVFLSGTLWLGNYRNIWRFFPLSKSRNVLLRTLGIIIWGGVLLFALFFVFTVVTDI
ncbi:MAG: serine/threonine protein kinase [Clostridiales bacterium]|nr:serine/threonine protein kinase [Clostridiales bacterium]